MASWSVMLRHPKDLGYNTHGYDLPKLHKIEHTVDVEYKSCFESGMLFPMQAQTMGERLKARRSTIKERVNKAVDIANSSKECFVIWCNLNDEADMITSMVDGAVNVKGGDDEKKKEQTLDSFSNGNIRVLVTKPSICGFGMNWQHCHNTIFVGLNDSFEQIYQAIRRFWRFGQKNEVYAHFIASEIEGAVVANIARKEQQAEHMANQMIKHMSDLTAANIKGATRETLAYLPQQKMELPKWIM
jgi:hypothetical protein